MRVTVFEAVLWTVIVLIHPIASYFFWRSAAWNVSKIAFGAVLSTAIIFKHPIAS